MMSENSLGLEFFQVCDKYHEHIAIKGEDREVTYGQLKMVVQSFAIRMRDHGVDKKSKVFVDTSDMVAALSSLLASSLLGAQFSFANRRLAKSGQFEMTHFFKTENGEQTAAFNYITIDDSWSPHSVLRDKQAVPDFKEPVDTQRPWLYTSTTGSTGLPKTVALTQAMVFSRSMAYSVDFIPLKTTLCSLFVAASRPFISRGIACLLNGGTIVDSLNTDFWLESGVTIVSGSPIQIRDAIGDKILPQKIATLQTSGAKLENDSIIKLLDSFETVAIAYGSTETNRSFLNIHTLNKDGSLESRGSPLDSDIEILDEHGSPVTESNIGVVRIRNKYLADGYQYDQMATSRAFKGGWFYPGDQAHWGENGQLVIHGRVDNVINLDGIKINAQTVETVLRSSEGVVDAIVFRNPRDTKESRIIAFIQLEPLVLQKEVILQVFKLCVEKLDEFWRPAKIFPVASIPRNENGKPDRDMCEKMVLNAVGKFNLEA